MNVYFASTVAWVKSDSLNLYINCVKQSEADKFEDLEFWQFHV